MGVTYDHGVDKWGVQAIVGFFGYCFYRCIFLCTLRLERSMRLTCKLFWGCLRRRNTIPNALGVSFGYLNCPSLDIWIQRRGLW